MPEYIAREVLLAQLRAMESYNVSPMYRRGYDDCVATVLKAPAADVAPVVHGRWIDDGSGIIICPECERGYNLHAKYTHYCPNCGAKMDGDKEAT